jgi:hypothetical protein
MTRKIAPLVLVVLLGLGPGCARKDWIEHTLVTVDVTGVWAGSYGTGMTSQEVRLELEQQGPKVTGYFRRVGAGWGSDQLLDGPIDGTVGGDVFSFRVNSGTAHGEMTVSGDEMRGNLRTGRAVLISVQRVDSSVPPRLQQQ